MELFFRKEGSGDPLVILHGLYGSSDNWTGIARKLAGNFTVYCLDHRNHGHSPHSTVHSYKAMQEDLNGFLEEHTSAPVILLGHSMGGKVAMYYAADHPERIRKLIIADIAPKNYMENCGDSQLYLHRNILTALQEMDISLLKNRQQVEEKLAEKLDDCRTIKFLLKNVTFDHDTHLLKWRLNLKALYDNLREIEGGINDRWFEGRIPITSYPVAFIRGCESPYIKDSDIPALKNIYPEASVIDIPGAGHWLHAEQPELFLRAVLDFCN